MGRSKSCLGMRNVSEKIYGEKFYLYMVWGRGMMVRKNKMFINMLESFGGR